MASCERDRRVAAPIACALTDTVIVNSRRSDSGRSIHSNPGSAGSNNPRFNMNSYLKHLCCSVADGECERRVAAPVARVITDTVMVNSFSGDSGRSTHSNPRSAGSNNPRSNMNSYLKHLYCSVASGEREWRVAALVARTTRYSIAVVITVLLVFGMYIIVFVVICRHTRRGNSSNYLEHLNCPVASGEREWRVAAPVARVGAAMLKQRMQHPHVSVKNADVQRRVAVRREA